MSLNYYCYYCQCRVKVIPSPLPTCTQCLQQFVEEVASSSQNTDIDDNVQSNNIYILLGNFFEKNGKIKSVIINYKYIINVMTK